MCTCVPAYVLYVRVSPDCLPPSPRATPGQEAEGGEEGPRGNVATADPKNGAKLWENSRA